MGEEPSGGTGGTAMPDPEESQRDGDWTRVLEWVDAVADRFEAAWRSGPPPRICDFLGPETGQRRSALLAELVRIDRAYRRRRGESPDAADYPGEFPELREPDRAGDAAGGLRCPHCGNSIPGADPAARKVTCPGCLASFRVEPGPAAPFPLEDLPRPLGRFQLLELLGRGAFGAVYKAHDPQLDRLVAVKVPRAGACASAEEEGRFLREARSAAQLAHPGIVPVHEVGFAGPMPYIVSDYVEGPMLARLLADRRPGFREAAELAAAVADA